MPSLPPSRPEAPNMWREADPLDRPLITYSGKLPDRLYRYRSVNVANVDRLIDSEIIEGIIYLAGLKELNDPDEGRFLVKFDGDYARIVEFWRKALRSIDPTLDPAAIEVIANANADDVVKAGYVAPEGVANYTRHVLEHVIRIACFTELPLNYSMWTNYAKYVDPVNGIIDHAGVCIEYQCDDNWRGLNLHPVEYSDTIPELNVVERSELSLVKTLYSKSEEWRCEEEWRIMSTLQTKPPFPKNFAANSRIKLEGGVTGVLFGLNTPDSLIDEVIKRVRGANLSIAFRRVTRNPITFARQLTDLAPRAH